MIDCPQCKHQNKDSSVYCIKCGKKLISGQNSTNTFSKTALIPGETTASPMPANSSGPRKTVVLGTTTSNHNENMDTKTAVVGGQSTVNPMPAGKGGRDGRTRIHSPHSGSVKPTTPVGQDNSQTHLVSNRGESPLVGFLVCRSFNGDTNGVFWPLRSGRTYIGRDPSESQIVLPFDNISGAHAVIIFRSNGKNWISDNNSMNGTFVDGEDIGPDKIELTHGDKIMIGDIVLEVVLCSNVRTPRL